MSAVPRPSPAALALLAALVGCGERETSAPDADADASADAVGDGDASAGDATAAVDTDSAPDATAHTDVGPEADTGEATVADTDADADAADAVDVPGPDPNHPFLRDGFLKIAHRGGGRLAPEETLEAYRNAIAIGVDVIEIDVHSTADGVVVCMHDDDVDRTTDGSGRIHALTFDDLRELDAGYTFSPDGGVTFPYRGAGVRVPTMDEVLTEFADQLIAIEIKQSDPPIVDEVVSIIEAHEAIDRVVIASFDDATIAAVRARNATLVTALAAGEMFRFSALDARTEPRYVPPSRVIQAPWESATAEFVERAHRHGMLVHVWTVNDRDQMQGSIAAGVDGIFTDDPALLADVVEGAAP